MISKIKQGTKILHTLSEYVVDDIEDVAKIPRCAMGSTVYVIHTQETYMADGKGVWYPKTGSGSPIPCDCIEESTIWENFPDY